MRLAFVDVETTGLEAVEVNGYYDGHPDWKNSAVIGSVEAKEDYRKFIAASKRAMLTAYHLPFDKGFLQAELECYGLVPQWDRRGIELMSYGLLVALDKGLDKMPLHAIYESLGGPKLPEHRAMADIERGKFVFMEAHRRFFHGVKTDTPDI